MSSGTMGESCPSGGGIIEGSPEAARAHLHGSNSDVALLPPPISAATRESIGEKAEARSAEGGASHLRP